MRFKSLTDSLPKPLLPLANRPIIEYLITALVKAGCTEIIVTTGYAGEQLRQFLETIRVSSSVKPVVSTGWERGPLASFQAAIRHLSAREPFILVPGDLYISASNLKHLISSDSEMAILYDAQKKQPGTQIQLDTSGNISAISQSDEVLADHYSSLPAFRTKPVMMAPPLPGNPSSKSTVYSLIRQWLDAGNVIQGIPITDTLWCDIDTPIQLLELNHHLLTSGWPPDPLPSGTYIPAGQSLEGPIQDGDLTLGNDVRIIGPVLLGSQVQVGENSVIRDGTTLGDSTIVRANAELAQCITLPNTKVPTNVDLRRCILDAIGNIVHFT
jgi:glucose-1-phosphate thymidylyltransferase